jgi:hypothetical protein
MIAWQMDDPLARAPGESRRANALLRQYADQVGRRSLRRLCVKQSTDKHATQPPPWETVRAWSSRHEWQARVAQYDRLEAQRLAALRNAAEATEIARWAARRAAQREREWQLSEQIYDRLAVMLATPLFTVTSTDGRTIITPARWTWADAGRLLLIASRLQHLATELPPDHRLVDDPRSAADLYAALLAVLGAQEAPGGVK